MRPSLICVDLRSPEQRRAARWSQGTELGATPLLELRAANPIEQAPRLERVSPLHEQLWLPANQHTSAAGAAIARQWATNKPLPPLLVAIGVASQPILSGLTQQLGSGGCLLLDQGAEHASLRNFLSLLVCAPRLLATSDATLASWRELLKREWDAELDPSGALSTAESSRDLAAAALQAREDVLEQRRRLRQQPVDLAWNRVQLDLQELAPLIQDPAERAAYITAGLASAGFRHRWYQPGQAVQTMAQLLEHSGCCGDGESARAALQLLPAPMHATPASTPGYAVHLHAYHLPEAAVILQRLSELPLQPEQLVITTPNPTACEQQLQQQLKHLPSTAIHMHQVANSGRNIGALMAVADQIHSEVLLHLHTKDTSPADPTAFIHRWMHYLITTLLSQVPNWLMPLHQGQAVAAFPLDPNRRQLGRNTAGMQQLLHEHQQRKGCRPERLQLHPCDTPIYPMGAMLALRRSFLIRELKPIYQAIPAEAIREPLAADGTPLHAFERAIPWIAALEGQSVLLLEPPQGLSR